MSSKQLSLIPESLLKHQVLKAADYERSPEDWSRKFELEEGEALIYYNYKDSSNRGFIWFGGRDGTRSYGVDELPVGRVWPPGTPTGDALRLFLRRWGWIPKNERSVTAPQEHTRTII